MRNGICSFILVILTALATGCSKRTDSNQVSNNTVAATNTSSGHPIFYNVEGFHDIEVRRYVDTVVKMPVSVKYYPSDVRLNVQISSLPAGVTVTPTSVAGYDSFDTTFIFSIKIDTPGIFPVQITTGGGGGKYDSRSGYKFNIKVTP